MLAGAASPILQQSSQKATLSGLLCVPGVAESEYITFNVETPSDDNTTIGTVVGASAGPVEVFSFRLM